MLAHRVLRVCLAVVWLLAFCVGSASARVAERIGSEATSPPAQQAQPYAGDPVAPRQRPASVDPNVRFYAETGHTLSGVFLDLYRRTGNAGEVLGLPLTEGFPQQLADGSIYVVQYFERARMEWHPTVGSSGSVALGALGSGLLAGRTFDRAAPVATARNRAYFAETGHTISNGFLAYWKAKGGLAQFGYPLSEEMGEDGVTVQYFERARFEYHSDLSATPYAVQLSPVGYLALKAARFNVPMGTLVRFEPPKLAEGHTALVEVAASYGVTVTGEYEGRALLFKHEPDRGVAWALLGAVPFRDVGTRAVTLNFANGDGGARTVTRTLEITSYPFPSESLRFDAETAALLDPKLTGAENETLARIFAGRTPEQYWSGAFRVPLDGKIRVTSAFATRRCYNCPNGSKPTSYHGGLDMGAAEGTPVHAPGAGKVVFAGRLVERGNAVIIDHGLGVFTLLAHNSKLLVTPGQMVAKGDTVSLSGNTGLSNGPHLHWEVHVSGPPVEPLEWVARAMP
jgi:murein DD-endopeptidase MepM/ murein hydrolase activator NlpD